MQGSSLAILPRARSFHTSTCTGESTLICGSHGSWLVISESCVYTAFSVAVAVALAVLMSKSYDVLPKIIIDVSVGVTVWYSL